MSIKVRTFKMLYEKGFIAIGAVKQAVIDGGLTEEEYKLVTGEDYK